MTRAAEKKSMRAAVKARLTALDPAEVVRQSSALCRHLMAAPEFASARCIMLYAPMAGEADCREAARAALAAGKTVVLPGLDWEGKRLVPRRVMSVDAGLVSVRGTPGPAETAPEASAAEIGVVVTPGLAFDLSGGRLGRGAGFYDRFLASAGLSAWAVGFALAEQVVAEVPMDALDARVDAVVTPEGVFRPGGREAAGH